MSFCIPPPSHAGTSDTGLDNTISRSRQSPTGDLICDALIHYVVNETDFDTTNGAPLDFCMTNGGGLRASIPAVRVVQLLRGVNASQ